MRLPAFLLFALLIGTALGQATTPNKGSADRTAIMNALRIPVERDLKQKVQFKISWLKVQNGWAFLKGIPQQRNGKPIDYKKTQYREAIEDGAFDDWVCALLRKKNGKWTVVQFQIGATDVPYVTWPDDYKAPIAIFDMPK
jgi:hypothetical protein